MWEPHTETLSPHASAMRQRPQKYQTQADFNPISCPPRRPPEAMTEGVVTKAVDVWSFGERGLLYQSQLERAVWGKEAYTAGKGDCQSVCISQGTLWPEVYQVHLIQGTLMHTASCLRPARELPLLPPPRPAGVLLWEMASHKRAWCGLRPSAIVYQARSTAARSLMLYHPSAFLRVSTC